MTTQLTAQPVLKPQPVPSANDGHVSVLSADERLLRKAVDRCLKAQLGEVLERLEGGAAYKGGPGSGNFGHEGRPGEVGGSASAVVLHGTSSKNLDSIMKNGLQPQTGKRRVWRQLSTGGERTGSVFVLDTKLKDLPENAKDLYDVSGFSDATSAAQSYARDAAVGKQRGVIIVARIPKSELKQDIVGSRTSLEGGKAAKMVLGGIAPENILGYVELPTHWQDRAPRFRRKGIDDDATIVFIPVAMNDEENEETKSLKSTSPTSTVPTNLTKWDQAVMREVRPIWFGLFKKGGDKALKEIRRFPKHARKMAVLSWAEMEASERVEVKGGPGSGNFGHEGRPGEVGGSGQGNEAKESTEPKTGESYRGKVFHGTSYEFEEFDMEEIGKHRGTEGTMLLFTDDMKEARDYATSYESEGKNPRVITAQIELKNPLVVSVSSDPAIYYDNHAKELTGDFDDSGHDGIIVRGKRDGKPVSLFAVEKPEETVSIEGSESVAKQKSLKAAPSIVIPEWIEDPDVLDALEKEMFRFAQGINQTTADTLREELMDGMENGETISQLANRISDISDEWVEGWRSEMIARTETARAFTTGHIEAWRSTGVVSRKVWVAAGDACVFCREMDGTVVDLDENFFDQGDEQTADWRGQEIAMGHDYSDVNGPPLHPNCRCVLVAELDEKKAFAQKGKDGDEDGRWVTMHGSPVFIREGQSAEDAAKERFGRDKEEQPKPSKEMIDRASKVFTSIQDVSTPVGKAADNQMRGGVLSEKTGVFKEFTEKSKATNLGKIVSGLNELKEQDPEGFEAARQWDLADRFGVKNYKDIPNEVTVWRGHGEEESLGKFTNVSHKKEIADKFGESGVVTEFRIKKDDIVFALSNSVFDEGELIVKGKSLQQVGRTVSEAASGRIAFREWSSSVKAGSEIRTTDGRIGKLVNTGVGTSLIVEFPEGTDYLFKFSQVKR